MITLSPYQIFAVYALSRTRRGILKCPAGGGKTVIAMAALASVLPAKERHERLRVLWLAGTIDLLNQAESTMAMFPSVCDNADITFSCPQSVTGSYDLVIVDECQHAAAATWASVIERIPARWGLSATPERDDELAEDVFSLIGPIVYEVRREDVKRITSARVNWLQIGSDYHHQVRIEAEKKFAAMWKKMPIWVQRQKGKKEEIQSRAMWQSVIEAQAADNQFKSLLKDLCNKLIADGKHVLAICRTIEQCNDMAKELGGHALTSKIGKRKREQLIDDMRNGMVRLVFATSIADEGLDVPRLDALVMVAPSRSKRLAEQRTGRVLREYAGKQGGEIYDFTGGHYMLTAQAKARGRVYTGLGYEQGSGV